MTEDELTRLESEASHAAAGVGEVIAELRRLQSDNASLRRTIESGLEGEREIQRLLGAYDVESTLNAAERLTARLAALEPANEHAARALGLMRPVSSLTPEQATKGWVMASDDRRELIHALAFPEAE